MMTTAVLDRGLIVAKAYPMGRRLSSLGLSIWLLTSGACGGSGETARPTSKPAEATGPRTFRVRADGPSALVTENFVFGTYFPATVKARPGDTLVFDNLSSHDIHTITFGVKRDRSNSPLPETKAVQANPVAFGRCFTDADPNPDLEACPGAPPAPPASGAPPPPPPPYSGKGYWNSGVLFPAGAPPSLPKSVSVQLAPSIAPGSYPYVCLLHPLMAGQVEVVASDADRLSPAAVSKAGDEEFQRAQADAAGLKEPTAGTNEVTGGWGDDVVAVDRFVPPTISIKTGDTVTWNLHSPYMPHTVSFESPFRDPTEPNAFLPAGAKSRSSYSSGVAHSGMIGPPPYYRTSTFSLQFEQAGTYSYLCILHPGMEGKVEVK